MKYLVWVKVTPFESPVKLMMFGVAVDAYTRGLMADAINQSEGRSPAAGQDKVHA
jgi:hypothetical protein